MSKSNISRHMKENYPWINKGGIHQLAPQGLNPLLAGFRITGHVLPYKMFLFTFSNTVGTTLVTETLMNTIDPDLFIEHAGTGGLWRIKTRSGKPIKGYNSSRMFLSCLTTSWIFGSATLPFPPLVQDNKANWTNLQIPFYTVDTFGVGADASTFEQVAALILYDLPSEQINVNVQTS